MTREEYGKMLDRAAESFPPDWNSEEWINALIIARDRLIKEWMHTHPGLLEQLKEASESYKSLLNKYTEAKLKKYLLANKYGAPRELTLEEAQEINPRYNERMGKITIDVEGNIDVEHPYPGHKVVFWGTFTSGSHVRIDGRDIEDDEEMETYYFGEK